MSGLSMHGAGVQKRLLRRRHCDRQAVLTQSRRNTIARAPGARKEKTSQKGFLGTHHVDKQAALERGRRYTIARQTPEAIQEREALAKRAAIRRAQLKHELAQDKEKGKQK